MIGILGLLCIVFGGSLIIPSVKRLKELKKMMKDL